MWLSQLINQPAMFIFGKKEQVYSLMMKQRWRRFFIPKNTFHIKISVKYQ